jgi:hypothetical protein
VPGGLFKSPNWEGYTTAMNVSQREGLGADRIMANDKYSIWNVNVGTVKKSNATIASR